MTCFTLKPLAQIYLIKSQFDIHTNQYHVLFSPIHCAALLTTHTVMYKALIGEILRLATLLHYYIPFPVLFFSLHILHQILISSEAPVCCRQSSAGWFSEVPRVRAPRSACWAPPVSWSVSSPAAQNWPQEQTALAEDPTSSQQPNTVNTHLVYPCVELYSFHNFWPMIFHCFSSYSTG